MRVARNVADLQIAQKFYAEALGFQPTGPIGEDAALAEILGVERVRVLRMRLGAQEIELSECFCSGLAYPENIGGNNVAFQHIAIVTTDIAVAYSQVMGQGAQAISTNGPQLLPQSSGGVKAFKFRDPDGHPLELLEFPVAAGKAATGYDHSAISVSDVERSVAFYAGIGILRAAQQVNRGVEQDALDGLRDVVVDVVALRAQATPHVELLHYRRPEVVSNFLLMPNDIAADRLVFGSPESGLRLLKDPDGHLVLLDGR